MHPLNESYSDNPSIDSDFYHAQKRQVKNRKARQDIKQERKPSAVRMGIFTREEVDKKL